MIKELAADEYKVDIKKLAKEYKTTPEKVLQHLVKQYQDLKAKGQFKKSLALKKMIDEQIKHHGLKPEKVYEFYFKDQKLPAKAQKDLDLVDKETKKRGWVRSKVTDWNDPLLVTYSFRSETLQYHSEFKWWMHYDGDTITDQGKSIEELLKYLGSPNRSNPESQLQRATKWEKMVKARYPEATFKSRPREIEAWVGTIQVSTYDKWGYTEPLIMEHEEYEQERKKKDDFKKKLGKATTLAAIGHAKQNLMRSLPHATKDICVYTMGVAWDELTPSVMSRIMRDCIQLSRVCASNRTVLRIASSSDVMDKYLKFLNVERTAHMASATYWRVYAVKSVAEIPEHAGLSDIIWVDRKAMAVPRLRYDPNFPAKIWYPVYHINQETVPINRTPPVGPADWSLQEPW